MLGNGKLRPREVRWLSKGTSGREDVARAAAGLLASTSATLFLGAFWAIFCSQTFSHLAVLMKKIQDKYFHFWKQVPTSFSQPTPSWILPQHPAPCPDTRILHPSPLETGNPLKLSPTAVSTGSSSKLASPCFPVLDLNIRKSVEDSIGWRSGKLSSRTFYQPKALSLTIKIITGLGMVSQKAAVFQRWTRALEAQLTLSLAVSCCLWHIAPLRLHLLT